jgi:serine/threonine protein kinase
VGEEIFGTPHYTAPEVVDSPHSVDYRADIFSVGVMLHELLTGKLPADDLRPASLIARCDIRFDAIIKRATQPMPAARYASAEEMAKDLQAIADSLISKTRGAAGAPRPSVRRPRQAAARKNSSNFPGILMLLLAVGIGAYSFSHFRKKQPPQLVILKEPAAVLPPPIDLTPEPAPAPDPRPNTKPIPSPMPEPEILDPEPDTTAVSEPARFDVPEFFERARKIMLERAAPAIAKYNSSLIDNFWSFEKSILICAGNAQTSRAGSKEALDALKAIGNRIPDSLESPISRTSDAKRCHKEALVKQKNIDFQLNQSLSELASTYILGLEKQIERLKADNDTGAIELIEREIELTRETDEYFPGLMMENPPAAE